jgi:nitronate monooxygenase
VAQVTETAREPCRPCLVHHLAATGGLDAAAIRSNTARRSLVGYSCRRRSLPLIAVPPLPSLTIKGTRIPLPIVQGGMGVGVSLAPLARAVARAGGLGLISSACLDRIVGERVGRPFATYEAVRHEVVSGAGLPLALPAIKPPGDTALIPIVSSARALDLICRRWARQHYRPDAVVLEGPLAGGHLGFRADQVDLEENTLERLLPSVKEVAQAHGDFPLIVAGGIYTHEDIRRFLALGADGVQMGTRFLATEESSASEAYKQAVLRARPEGIVVANDPGSPCGLPFRVLCESPMYQSALARRRPPRCDKGYVLLKDARGRFTRCPAKDDNEHFFCICDGLCSAAGHGADGEEPLFTTGTTAARVDRILSVRDLMAELAGTRETLPSAA